MRKSQSAALEHAIIRDIIRDNADAQSPKRGSRIYHHLNYDIR